MIPHIPASAPFSPEQRAWLNGFMAGLYSVQEVQGNALPGTHPAPRPVTPVMILFGSQTGTAEGLARTASKKLAAQGFSPTVAELDAFKQDDLARTRHLLVITSTHGDGEMPDNALGFWDWLSSDEAPPLDATAFSVLALGDSSYLDFCQAGRLLDARLEALGARRLHPRIDCDVEVDEPFATWLDGVMEALRTATDDGVAGTVPLAQAA